MSAGSWPRASKSQPCPSCGHSRRCHLRADGGAVRCYWPEEGNGWGHLQEEGEDGQGAYEVRYLDAPAKPSGSVTPLRPTAPPALPVADVATLTKVYGRLLALCPLSPDRIERLCIERALTPSDVAELRLGYLPDRREWPRITATLAKEFGSEVLLQVPGFRPCAAGLELVAAGPGLLIPYLSTAGDILVKAVRIRLDEAGQGGRYRWLSGGGGPSVIQAPYTYRPDGAAAVKAVLCEGEFKAVAAAKHFFARAIGLPGVGQYRLALRALPRKAQEVTIAHDADQWTNPQVARGVLALVDELRANGYEVTLARWWDGIPTDETPKGIDDAIAAGTEVLTIAGGAVDDYCRELAAHHGLSQGEEAVRQSGGQGTLGETQEVPKEKRKGSFEKLLLTAERQFNFFSAGGTAYLSPGNGLAVNLESSKARDLLFLKAYRHHGKPPTTENLQKLIYLKSAESNLEGPYCPVFRRIGTLDGKYYLDLCRPDGQVIEMTADGWEVIASPPGLYWRRTGTANEELPIPVKGGDPLLLSKLVNATLPQIKLMIASLVAILRGGFPFPVFVVEGPAGSAKTNAVKVLKFMVDPEEALVSSLPRNEEDLSISCRSSHILAMDNIDRIKTEQSNDLCRVSTGAHHRKRTLYSSGDETVMKMHNPIFLSGLDGIVEAADLGSRSILWSLEEIAEGQRLEEAKVWPRVVEYRPQILGGILDAFVAALANLDQVELPTTPRLMDFLKFVTAAEHGLPWKVGEAVDIFLAAQDALYDQAIEKDRVALAIVNLMEYRQSWQSTAGELLDELSRRRPDGEDYWPSTAHTLSKRIVKAIPLLKAKGISFSRQKERRGMVFSFSTLKRYQNASQASQASPNGLNTGIACDAYPISKRHQASQASPNASPFDRHRRSCDAQRDACDAQRSLGDAQASRSNRHKTEVCDACDACDAFSPLNYRGANGKEQTPPLEGLVGQLDGLI